MAGVKGRSGGARPNTGGARPGAGRKKKPTVKLVPDIVPEVEKVDGATSDPSQIFARVEVGEPFDPRPTLELVALGQLEVSVLQFKAMTALLPYVHIKKGDGGKKEGKESAAKTAALGKFAAPPAPPRLASVK